jgi:hypothetical protein
MFDFCKADCKGSDRYDKISLWYASLHLKILIKSPFAAIFWAMMQVPALV